MTIASPAAWGGFLAFVLAMLALDLGVFHRRAHVLSFREALGWSGVWVGLATLFGLGLWWHSGPTPALQFATGYVLEKALSVDNLFVILAIMQGLRVPGEAQHRVLAWGVLGALVMRGVLIFAGTALLQLGPWVLYVFGALLIFGAVKLFASARRELREGEPPFTENRAMRLVRRLLPVTQGFHGPAFTVKEGGRRFATPLLLALFAIEGADAVFALDSIPAVFSVTTDAFIVMTSNIFAILGLRSLFFVLAEAANRLWALKYGLVAVLGFVGLKMLLGGLVHVPVGLSLGIICALLVGSVVASAAKSPPRSGVEPVVPR